MTTHAQYIIWAGFKRDELEGTDLDDDLIDQVLYQNETVEINGLTLETIYMHGEIVGVGIEVLKLNWEPTAETLKEYDFNLGNHAFVALDQLRQIFDRRKVAAQAKVYHHIDLGSR